MTLNLNKSFCLNQCFNFHFDHKKKRKSPYLKIIADDLDNFS